MGRPKLLLPWGRSSVLEHLINQWRQLGAQQVTVVCGGTNTAITAELDRLGIPDADRILNPHPERGMFSSIQCAAQWGGWQPELTHWAIILGDQPHVPLQTLGRTLSFAADHCDRICQPGHGGRPRHPVILPRDAFQGLAASKDPSLRDFLARSPQTIAVCEIDDPALDLDLDTPADYERAVQTFCPTASASQREIT